MADPIADDDEEGFLGSIGFMFDAQHVRLTKTVTFGDNISLQLRLIGEDPGMLLHGVMKKICSFSGNCSGLYCSL